ncbi:MAG TPA: biotin/lipoate A/B protein ligase family protein [Kiritimatiellia bacterium]|nr:biotin/lipoate A/B protein ligase family protein [Kiritimatiellia bacterium]
MIFSKSTIVHENLALEDCLLDQVDAPPTVLIYRNAPSVVLGKNQNPWRECAVSRLDELGVTLARRVSGGGAVFHDDGNVNISCIIPRDKYQRCEMLNLFIKGLARGGIKSSVSGGTSLVYEDGRKISGNAFCYRRNNVLHHGTLLWKSNLELLRKSLIPEVAEMLTRAVASVPMPVVNLSDVVMHIPLDEVVGHILDKLSGKWGRIELDDGEFIKREELANKSQKLSQWDWVIGATPDFECSIGSHQVSVHRGRIERVNSATRHPWVGKSFAPDLRSKPD